MAELSLVLLPGLDGTGVLFHPLLGYLPNGIRPTVVAYPPDKMLGYDNLLPMVLAALPRSSPFVLLGESFSGPLALMAAATRPPGLKAVILCATFVRSPFRFRAGWLGCLVRPWAFRLYPQLSMTKALLSGYSTPELRARSAEALREVRPEVLAHRVRAVLQVNVLPQLAACPVPILYLRGKRDLVVPGHNLAEITAACPSVQVVHLPAPHLVLQTQPAAAAAAISAFVADTLSPRHNTAPAVTPFTVAS